MIRHLWTAALGTILLLFPALAFSPNEKDRSIALRNYDLAGTPTSRMPLPKELIEISGLACSEDGRIFAHNDEIGTIFKIDERTGTILTSFHLNSGGKKNLREDFEGIAIAHGRIYLSTSAGDIYECAEAENGSSVDYTVYKTKLGKRYEMEGLCYDPVTNALLLPVKSPLKKKKRDRREIFSFSLRSKTLDKEPRFVLDESALESTPDGNFDPSSIEYNPASKTFFLLAAQGHAILELSASGEVLGQVAINKEHFFQPEGLTFTPDGRLIISSEGDKKEKLSAFITVFSPLKRK